MLGVYLRISGTPFSNSMPSTPSKVHTSPPSGLARSESGFSLDRRLLKRLSAIVSPPRSSPSGLGLAGESVLTTSLRCPGSDLAIFPPRHTWPFGGIFHLYLRRLLRRRSRTGFSVGS